MFCKLANVRISAIRAVVPANELRIDDEVQHHGGSVKKIERLRTVSGIDRRRICPLDVTASDLCTAAAEALFYDIPFLRTQIEALFLVSQSPDWYQPATACELQHRLNLSKACAAFDVNQGCTGYIYGLWLGASLIASGSVSKVLLLAGDANARGRDVRNRVTAPVFGDGGSATLMERDESAPEISFGFGTDGSDFEAIIVPGGQSRIPFSHNPEENMVLVTPNIDPAGNIWELCDTYMDGGAIFNFTMDIVPNHIKEAMKFAGLTQENINWLMLHQANRHITSTLADKTGFGSAKTPDDTFGLYGNLAVASLPVALCSAFHNNENPGKTLMCGYGIGLSWGSCLCDMKKLNCAPVIDFEPDPGRPNRQQRIERWQKILRGEISRHDQK